MTRAGNPLSRPDVGGYELLSVLGRGGMATVYLARQVGLDREVALKELSLSDSPDTSLARRFLREARVAGSLTHPNIVTVHEYLEADGRPYIAMEWVPGGSVRPFVGNVSLAEAGGVLQGLLAGLAHAERRGVVHRDIKPENVMVTAEGSVKITDFGIAKATSAAATMTNLTTSGTTLGTPRYMAPERAMAQPVGPWTDLFSVGVMAFELLAGHTPFHGTRAPMDILMRQINDPIPPLTDELQGADPDLSDWIARMVEKDPAARTPSAAVAWTELDAIMVGILGPRWLLDAPLGRRRRTEPRGRLEPRGATTAAVRATPAIAPTLAPDSFRLEPPAGPRTRRPAVPWQLRLAVVAAVVIAVASAGARALRSHEANAGGSPVTVSSGALTLTAPAGWHVSAELLARTLPLSRAVTVRPVGGGDAGSATAGMMSAATAGNVSLLPPGFLQSLPGGGEIPPRRRVVLRPSGVEAWRYADLAVGDSAQVLTVYTVPTSAGVAAVVCRPPATGRHRFGLGCAAVAGRLRIRGARTFPVGPSARYADVLGRVLRRLQRLSRRNAGALAGASGPAAQATALRSLAGYYAAAAGSLGGLALSPADRTANARLAAALRGSAEAYAGAAATAGLGDGDAVIAAQASIGKRHDAIDGALAGLEAAGYEVAGNGGVEVPARTENARATPAAASGVGDSRSDDPSDDEPDEDED